MEKITKKKKTTRRASIGGQALIEGVMMMGVSSMAVAVRDQKGEILLSTTRFKKKRSWIYRVPLVRGTVALFASMIIGVKALLKSAQVFAEDEETGDELLGGGSTFIAVFLGMAMAIGLFMFVPSLISSGLQALFKINDEVWMSVIEGVSRLIIFIAYLVLIAFMKDIKRTFMYHGAEHKTINCYEHDLPLTVENVKNSSRIHDRCGTTFLFFVIAISIVIFSISNAVFAILAAKYPYLVFTTKWYGRLLIRLLLLPLVAGISYELLKLLAKLPNNAFTRIIKAPGLALQFVTTKEPDNSMIEVAIKSFLAVDAMDKDKTLEEVDWETINFQPVYAEIKQQLKDNNIEEAEADWIFCSILSVNRLNLKTLETIKRTKYIKAKAIVKQRIDTKKPLAYLLGNTEFCGYKITVNESVLIPRFETELLVEKTVNMAKELTNPKILDLCTGSGAIAYVLKKSLPAAQITASDISKNALKVAKSNLKDMDVKIIESNLLNNIEGTFDIIVSNPPYIATTVLNGLDEEVKKEPLLALDGGIEGMEVITRIINSAPKSLNDGGLVILEIGYDQSEKVEELLKTDFTDIEIIKDYEDHYRIVKARKK